MGKRHHPLLSRRAILTLAIAVGTTELLIAGALVLPQMRAELSAVLPAVVTALTNEAREEGKLSALKVSPVLSKAAEKKAEDMARRGYFSHNSPEGDLPWFWLDREGYSYEYAGENLAINFSDSEDVVRAWQDSPTHNMNLMGPRYTETGVGVAQGMYQGREAVFIVQFFAKPSLRDLSIKAAQSSVLGAETQAALPSMWERVVSSPRTYSTYVFITIATILIGVLLAGWGAHHPRALARGTLFVALLAGLMYVNKHVIFSGTELPWDSQNAAVMLSR